MEFMVCVSMMNRPVPVLENTSKSECTLHEYTISLDTHLEYLQPLLTPFHPSLSRLSSRALSSDNTTPNRVVALSSDMRSHSVPHMHTQVSLTTCAYCVASRDRDLLMTFNLCFSAQLQVPSNYHIAISAYRHSKVAEIC